MNWAALLQQDIMYVILAFIVLALIIWIYNKNNDDGTEIDIADLVTTNGKLDEPKLTRFVAWIVSTWGFVYLITIDKLTEWYFIGYMGAWVMNAIFSNYLNNKSEQTKDPYSKYRSKRYNYDTEDGER